LRRRVAVDDFATGHGLVDARDALFRLMRLLE